MTTPETWNGGRWFEAMGSHGLDVHDAAVTIHVQMMCISPDSSPFNSDRACIHVLSSWAPPIPSPPFKATHEMGVSYFRERRVCLPLRGRRRSQRLATKDKRSMAVVVAGPVGFLMREKKKKKREAEEKRRGEQRAGRRYVAPLSGT